ncbi:DUF2799 domain-containing protein [Aeromonas cavernicola]|uniref:DNA repair protein n=1 Tax=Aeromonas cavernicola TaxID=1006623 RepID=A0A2H9U0P1_9GAMM|nr:DUF2799 domain-containing protein [Aeromonas cavernicola]PJG57612.1 DNA repair protein [Aeromonas cavernicola]
MVAKSLLLILPLILTGCSALSENECRTISWYNLGYQDGEQGKSEQAARAYVSACGDYGLPVDEAEWLRGYHKGLTLYCLPELAYSKGKAGQLYRGVCPNDASFLSHYQRGYQEYQLAARLREISDELIQTEHHIERLEQQIRSEPDEEQRRYYRAQRYRAIRYYESLRNDYEQLRFPPRVFQFSFGS